MLSLDPHYQIALTVGMNGFALKLKAEKGQTCVEGSSSEDQFLLPVGF